MLDKLTPKPDPHESKIPSTSEIIVVENVSAGYDRNLILEQINLKIYDRDFVGIIGPNGGGKTTLLKVLLGLIPPSQGTVNILGYSPQKGRRYLGYVPQLFEFDRHFPLNVEEVVKMGRLSRRRLFQRYNRNDHQKVQEALEKVGLWELRHCSIGELSGGQRQRVYIARALVSDPQILLLDEPTASVDPKSQRDIYELLKFLNQTITILLISHDMGAISTYVKTIACLNRQLHYHRDRILTPQMLEQTYQCPIDLIAHGVPHRVLGEHSCDH